tara:strand:- start:69 stop:2510 length:2442 start_codon:yes stop_codon:yes gene_type:complete
MAKVVEVEIKAKTGKATQDVKDLNKEIKSTSTTAKSTGKGLSGAFKGLTTAVTSAIPALGALKTALISTGVGAIVVAMGSLVALFTKAAKVGAEFEKSLSTLKAITGQTSEELAVLSEQAKQLGATTQFTAIEVLGLQTELAKLGFSVRDIENSTPAILDLAASLEVDLASAAEFAGSVVRSFGLTTEETQRVVDVMSLSTSSSALNFEALRESLKLVAPTSRATGVSIEKTAALLGVLANNGLKGSVAGTGLSKTFIELNKKGLTLEEGMAKVANSTNKLNTAIDLVGIVGAKSFLSLAESGAEINQLEKDFEGAEGAARSMAEVRLDNLAGDTTKLSSAWEGFLIGLEDGDGIINAIQRGSIQLLTKGITALGTVIDFLGFSFKETWNDTKLVTSGSVDFLKGSLLTLGGAIKLFANQALLQFSKIPIIGKAVDTDSVKINILEAKKALLEGEESIEKARISFSELASNRRSRGVRFAAQQEGKARRAEEKKQQELDFKELEEANKRKEELTEEEQEKLKKSREDLAKIIAKSRKQAEDLEDITEVQKTERRRERALKELEDVKLSETEKREAKKQINDLYDSLEADATETDAENKRAKKQKITDEEIASEKKRRDDTIKFRNQTFDNAVKLAGEETKLGKALLLAKQLLLAKDFIMSMKAAVKNATVSATNATVKGSEAAVEVAGSVAKAANTGPPGINLPFILSAIATGIGIIGSVKSAIKATKTAANAAGGSGGGGGGTDFTAPSLSSAGGGSAPPSFNIVGQTGTNQLADAIGGQNQRPLRTYVVASDVSSAQSLDRNIITGASLGG